MQKNHSHTFTLKKLNLNDKQDMIDCIYLSLLNKDVSPVIQTVLNDKLSQVYKLPSIPFIGNEKVKSGVDELQTYLKGKITSLETRKDIEKEFGKPIVQTAYKLYQFTNRNNKFRNGLYKVIQNNEVIGMFGIYIDKINPEGKIQHFNLNSFLKPATTQVEKLQSQGLGNKVTIEFYKILLDNQHEFAKDCTFDVKFVKTNKIIDGFQKKLGLYDITDRSSLSTSLDIIKGNASDFIHKAQQFVARSSEPKL